MFLRSVGSTDSRFRKVSFHDGLNILVAHRTDASGLGDSRNGTGKSSLIRIIRYLVGGNLSDDLKNPALSSHAFTAELGLPAADGVGTDIVTIRRGVTPSTRVVAANWSVRRDRGEMTVESWRELLATKVFQLPNDTARPTTGQLWGQLIRTTFGRPTKTHPNETDWETGVRLGYFLGLAPNVLGKAGAVARLERQRKAVREAIREGAFAHLAVDEADLRSRLAAARRRRDRAQEDLSQFKVDEQYLDHQKLADSISADVQALNDEALSLERRARSIGQAIEAETQQTPDGGLQERLTRMYAEIGVVLPNSVARRFDEVTEFHASVVRNRQRYLDDERTSIAQRLDQITAERSELDSRRAETLRLLRDSVALETFLDAQRSLAQLDSEVAQLERQLESVSAVGRIDTTLKLQTAEATAAVRAEIEERSANLERPIALFNELGSEIYTDRTARLLISPNAKGVLKVTPEISGDASDGIRGVEAFLLDVVCVVSSIEYGLGPRVLIHDSHLFDAVDHRQVASCLNIAARLAAGFGFQYIVAMNSDFLSSVEREGAFDHEDYVVDPILTDDTEDGGLFGFRFD